MWPILILPRAAGPRSHWPEEPTVRGAGLQEPSILQMAASSFTAELERERVKCDSEKGSSRVLHQLFQPSLDALNFRRQPPEKQAEIIARLPAFHADLSSFGEAKEVPAALEGLEELEELEELETILPLEDAVADLPVVPAQLGGLDGLAGLEGMPGQAAGAPGAVAATLSDEDRRRMARLLAAF